MCQEALNCLLILIHHLNGSFIPFGINWLRYEAGWCQIARRQSPAENTQTPKAKSTQSRGKDAQSARNICGLQQHHGRPPRSQREGRNVERDHPTIFKRHLEGVMEKKVQPEWMTDGPLVGHVFEMRNHGICNNHIPASRYGPSAYLLGTTSY